MSDGNYCRFCGAPDLVNRIEVLEKACEAAAYLIRKGAHYPSPLAADEEAAREALQAAGYGERGMSDDIYMELCQPTWLPCNHTLRIIKDLVGDAVDYQPTEQDRVLLDYAQTAQRRADPWVEFQYAEDSLWCNCSKARNPSQWFGEYPFRRKPHTVTLSYRGKEWELPVPNYRGNPHREVDICQTDEDDEKWSAALREIAAGGENG